MPTDTKPLRDAARFCNIRELSARTGIPERTLRSLYHARKLSGIRAGHRTLLFRPDQVIAELEKFTVKALA